MDKEIKGIISRLGVKIVEVPTLDAGGKYIAAINTIVLDSRLSKKKRLLTLLHELGHASRHAGNYILYNQTFVLHSKMENEAEEFMIKKMIEAKFSDPNFEPSTFNVSNFLDSYDIDYRYETIVKEFMTKYLTTDSKIPIFF